MLKKLILAGNVPFLAVIVLCTGAFLLGWQGLSPTPGQPQAPIAIADKSGLILQTILEHPTTDKATLQRQILAPVTAVLQHWSSQGYVVIDASRDDSGRYVVLALPGNTIDITAQLQQALDKAARESKAHE